MKNVAINALRRARGAFLIVHLHEAEVLDSLPLWFTRLFTALLRCADHRTGLGRTTYAALVAMLTPIQPRRGQRHFVPSYDQLRRALLTMEARQIIARDKTASLAGDALIFSVAPRYEKARPEPKLAGGLCTPPKAPKPNAGAGSEPLQSKTCRGFVHPSSIMTSILHSEAPVDNLQPRKPTREQRVMLAKLKPKGQLN